MEFAGDRMTIQEVGDHTVFTFGPAGKGRVCGDCQLCCRLVPVPEIGKQAGVKCPASRVGKGCTIYAERPMSCRTWSCRWLSDPETAGMKRPDRAHYVIDRTWDYVTAVDDATGEKTRIGVVQVWCDPNYPNAYKSAELRAYMLHQATEHRVATIIRFGRTDAVTVFAPPLTHDGEWHEKRGSLEPRNAKERAEALMLGESDWADQAGQPSGAL
jgi:hypothetical protein